MITRLYQKNILFVSAEFLMLACFSGCASSGAAKRALAVNGGSLLNTTAQESEEDAVSALRVVTGAMSDKEMTDEELYQAAKRMKDDPEAKTAVEAISSSFDQQNIQMKYSPVTGKRYSPHMEFDPETGVRLLPVE